MSTVSLLAEPVMAAREAARQLKIPASTLLYWLEGGWGGQRWYPPVLREEAIGSTDMTWGEVVEARYLRAYRQRNVSMQRLRPFISLLREEFGVPYPVAHFKPFIGDGRRLLIELQDRARLPRNLRIVYEATTGQTILDPRATSYLDRVDFAHTGQREALLIYPAGRESPVVMNPALSSAAATVRGVRTEVLAELHAAGEPAEIIAEDFGLPLREVKAAVAYEWGTAA